MSRTAQRADSPERRDIGSAWSANERAAGGRGPAGRDWSDLFLLLEVFFLTGTTAATRGLDTAAAWLAVPLSRAVSILIAARLLVAAVTLVVSHVTSSLLWWAIERSARLQLPCQ
jgi:hypothetical protein